jgi:hypothetical protein
MAAAPALPAAEFETWLRVCACMVEGRVSCCGCGGYGWLQLLLRCCRLHSPQSTLASSSSARIKFIPPSRRVFRLPSSGWEEGAELQPELPGQPEQPAGTPGTASKANKLRVSQHSETETQLNFVISYFLLRARRCSEVVGGRDAGVRRACEGTVVERRSKAVAGARAQRTDRHSGLTQASVAVLPSIRCVFYGAPSIACCI